MGSRGLAPRLITSALDELNVAAGLPWGGEDPSADLESDVYSSLVLLVV
jgi:hypothetical protein